MNSHTTRRWTVLFIGIALIGAGGVASPRDPDGLKADSPLAALVSRSEAARDGQAFGERNDGLLIPETVEFGGVHVGRFEVTRAQYAEFDSSLKVKSGEENLSATGMGYVKAYKYVLWLAARTGKSYRLPTDQEAHALIKLSRDGGNTLDHWLGRPARRDEVVEVNQMAAAAAGPSALLLPVGSLGGSADRAKGTVVFDLNGNAAEWTRNKDGDGVLVGRSADQPEHAVKPGQPSEAGELYRGFRVVLEVTP